MFVSPLSPRLQHLAIPRYLYFSDVVTKMIAVITNSTRPNHAHPLCLKIFYIILYL